MMQKAREKWLWRVGLLSDHRKLRPGQEGFRMRFSEFVHMEQEVKTVRCPICGKENRSGARFCGYCGSNLDSVGNTGKEKCEYLKSVRNRIAQQNNIPYASAPCTSTAPCEGICPACEAETAYLREMLEAKGAEGDTVVYGKDAGEALAASGGFAQNIPPRGEPRDMVRGLMRGPEWPEEMPDEPKALAGIPAGPVDPAPPKKESFLKRIKKAFGK